MHKKYQLAPNSVRTGTALMFMKIYVWENVIYLLKIKDYGSPTFIQKVTIFTLKNNLK